MSLGNIVSAGAIGVLIVTTFLSVALDDVKYLIPYSYYKGTIYSIFPRRLQMLWSAMKKSAPEMTKKRNQDNADDAILDRYPWFLGTALSD